ncbi:hypothetical protein BDR07DRAFT_1487875 [Suillus spraguei]|nr:hypothetical protein BDR07DRAFT_1487875 [Suillus spraguei]
MSHELHLTLPPEELCSEHDFCFEGYQFLQAGYQKSGSGKMNVCDLPGRLITLERLRDCAKSLPNPSSSENFPVLWCSPTIANITGNLPLPLLLPVGRHKCLASHVFDTFRTATLVEESKDPVCLDACPHSPAKSTGSSSPAESADVFPIQRLANFSPVLPFLSSMLSLASTSSKSLFSSASSLSSASLLPFMSSLLPSPQPNETILLRSSSLLTALLKDAETVIDDWQQEIINHMWSPVLPDGHEIFPLIPAQPDSLDVAHVSSLVVEGPDLQATAMGFASFVHSKLSGSPPNLPEDVRIEPNFDLWNIFHTEQTWNVAVASMLMQYLGFTPAEISPAEEWQNITKQMFASVLLGCPIIDMPDLYDFKHGFNMHVCSGTSFCDTLSTNYKTLIPIAYGRTITCPEDILAHLTVISADNTDVVPFGNNI